MINIAKQSKFKTYRVILALAFFLSTCFIFIDFREIVPNSWVTGITYLQFVPSLLKSIVAIGLISGGFIIVIALTALFGRVYCSTICPLGVLQDAVSWIRKKTSRKKYRYKHQKEKTILRYSFLAIPIIILIAGGGLIGIYLLDPYSVFGRSVSMFGQPVYLWMNNLLAGAMESMDIYLLYPEDIKIAKAIPYALTLVMLGIVVWFSIARGRFYCNTICPVGTLLGLLSKVSIFNIRFDEEKCNLCGKCAVVCKASCIDVKNQKVDFSRCVGCMNCIQACPEEGIKYQAIGAKCSHDKSLQPTNINVAKETHDSSRREAIVNISAAVVTLAGASGLVSCSTGGTGSTGNTEGETGSIENKIPTTIKPDRNFPVTPPGSLGLKHFTGICTACQLCVSACPTGVLKPSVLEYGVGGIMQPFMDYSTKYCNFDCVRCAEVCPTGAILSLTQENKKTTQIGKVEFIVDNCIVKTENTACGSCSEHCPTQAVYMVPYKGDITIPEINPEICVGCGACEYACPVKPYKAIYVDGNEIHEVAKLPEVEELEKTEMEEFPF